MKTVANYVLSFVVGFCVLTLWTVLPPQLYFSLLGLGTVAVLAGQNSEDENSGD